MAQEIFETKDLGSVESSSPPDLVHLLDYPDAFFPSEDSLAIDLPRGDIFFAHDLSIPIHPPIALQSSYIQESVDQKLQKIEKRHQVSWVLKMAHFTVPVFIGAMVGFLRGNTWGLLAGAGMNLFFDTVKYQEQKSYLKELRTLRTKENQTLSCKIFEAELDLTAARLEIPLNAICFILGGSVAESIERRFAKSFTSKATCKIAAQTALGAIIGGGFAAVNPRTRNVLGIGSGILAGGALGAIGGIVGWKIQKWGERRAVERIPDLTDELADHLIPLNEAGEEITRPLAERITIELDILESLWKSLSDEFKKPQKKVEELVTHLQKYLPEETILIQKLEEAVATTADPSRLEFLVQAYRVGYQLEGSNMAKKFLLKTFDWLTLQSSRSPSTLTPMEVEQFFLEFLQDRTIPVASWVFMMKGPRQIWEKLFGNITDQIAKQHFLQKMKDPEFWEYLLLAETLERIAVRGRKIGEIIFSFDFREKK